MLKNRIRNTKRFQEIVNAFLRNGFSHVLFRLGIIDRRERDAGTEEIHLRDIGKRLRLTLEELGPTFIKLGQIASTRRDLVPAEIADELEKLQDNVEAIPFADIKETAEKELGASLTSLFAVFDEEPLATASIGQVHTARLTSGEEVAVKVQRPGIRPTVKTDLSILSDLTKVLEENTDWAKRYRLRHMMKEFSRSLQNELNYSIEAKNSERIRSQFTDSLDIYIPAVYTDYSTDKVLTTEMIRGIKANDIQQLDEQGYDRHIIAERIVDSMFSQILEAGFFHGDPHPGNIFILPGNVVAYLDFGMTGSLPQDMKYDFASLLLYLRNGNIEGMIKVLTSMGILSDETDLTSFQHDLEQLTAEYYDKSLHEIDLGAVFMQLFQLSYQYKIQIPTEISILSKSILTVEGLIVLLDADFSIMEAVEPYGEKVFLQRFNPKNLSRRAMLKLMETAEIVSDLPADIKGAASTVKKGKVRLDINVQQMEIVLKRLDRLSNRLSLSIILLSFSILMVGLIIGSAIAGEKNMLWRLPVIEAGSVVAGGMFIFLIISIIRSGRT